MRTYWALHRSYTVPFSLVVGLSVATLVACSDGVGSSSSSSSRLASIAAPHGPMATTGNFAYGTNNDTHSIMGYTIDSAGTLTKMSGSPFPSDLQPNSIAIAEKGGKKFAYAANHGSDTITGYEINPSTGALTLVPNSPFATGDQPSFVTVDPLNRFVYVVNFATNNVTAYEIKADGGLTTVGTFSTGAGPQGIAVDETGTYAYVVNFNSANVSAYRILGSGALDNVVGSPFPAAGTGPNAIAVGLGPSKKFVYSANILSNSVTAFEINTNTATGALGALRRVGTFGTGGGPEGIAVDPTGRFVYVGNGSDDNISAFSITNTGTLLSLGRIDSGTDPEGMTAAPATDGSGKQFVYALNHVSNNFSAYEINSGGTLRPVGTFSFH